MRKYSDYTFNDPNVIKSFVHRNRLKTAYCLLDLKLNDSFLDFGAGDGTLAKLVAEKNKELDIVIYEPIIRFYQQASHECADYQNIRVVSDINVLKGQTYNKISCLEVLEHLGESDIRQVLETLSSLLGQNGRLIISVPLEIGLPGFFKNIFRFFKSSKNEKINWLVMVNSLLGRSQERSQPYIISKLGYIRSHVGFDHRKIKELLGDYFNVIKQQASPFFFLGPILNYSLYYVCSKKSEHAIITKEKIRG